MSVDEAFARPIPRSYWVRPGRLLAGEYPGALDAEEARRKLSRLIEAGVSHFVDLTEEGEVARTRPLTRYDATARVEAEKLGRRATHTRWPIVDQSVCDERAMIAILDDVDRAIEEGGIVYVHCWGGVGRTGLVVGCHLARHGVVGRAALERIAELRRGSPDEHRQSPENALQEAMVLGWPAGR